MKKVKNIMILLLISLMALSCQNNSYEDYIEWSQKKSGEQIIEIQVTVKGHSKDSAQRYVTKYYGSQTTMLLVYDNVVTKNIILDKDHYSYSQYGFYKELNFVDSIYTDVIRIYPYIVSPVNESNPTPKKYLKWKELR